MRAGDPTSGSSSSQEYFSVLLLIVVVVSKLGTHGENVKLTECKTCGGKVGGGVLSVSPLWPDQVWSRIGYRLCYLGRLYTSLVRPATYFRVRKVLTQSIQTRKASDMSSTAG